MSRTQKYKSIALNLKTTVLVAATVSSVVGNFRIKKRNIIKY